MSIRPGVTHRPLPSTIRLCGSGWRLEPTDWILPLTMSTSASSRARTRARQHCRMTDQSRRTGRDLVGGRVELRGCSWGRGTCDGFYLSRTACSACLRTRSNCGRNKGHDFFSCTFPDEARIPIITQRPWANHFARVAVALRRWKRTAKCCRRSAGAFSPGSGVIHADRGPRPRLHAGNGIRWMLEPETVGAQIGAISVRSILIARHSSPGPPGLVPYALDGFKGRAAAPRGALLCAPSRTFMQFQKP